MNVLNIDQEAAAEVQPGVEAFIKAWGQMGAVWGINRSTAAVHALLLTSPGLVTLDRIAQRLNISRGNASMCLKELRAWGVVRKDSRSGDRKDYFVTEDDVWTMFVRIARARKEREFDPAVRAVREALESFDTPAASSTRRRKRTGSRSEDDIVRRRFHDMDALLSGLDHLGSGMLKASGTPGLFRSLAGALAKLVGQPKGSR